MSSGKQSCFYILCYVGISQLLAEHRARPVIFLLVSLSFLPFALSQYYWTHPTDFCSIQPQGVSQSGHVLLASLLLPVSLLVPPDPIKESYSVQNLSFEYQTHPVGLKAGCKNVTVCFITNIGCGQLEFLCVISSLVLISALHLYAQCVALFTQNASVWQGEGTQEGPLC